MFSRRWDPGIGGGGRLDLPEQQGKDRVVLDWRFPSNLRGFDLDLKKRNFGKLSRIRVLEISITISIIIKTKSKGSPGIEFDFLNILYCPSIKENGGSTNEIWKFGISIAYDNKILWKGLGRRLIQEYQWEIYGINGDKDWLGYLESENHYKRDNGFTLCWNISTRSFTLSYRTKQSLSLIVFIMTHGQLVGNGGDMKEGESARKRMKILVPHFDNSALIKTYAKTLIGRCMNPPEQDMKALIQNIPKIWKLEDRVIGTDLGFGKFQFDFETENDIDTVMKLQPYHFDYWMLALARWQTKKTQLFPSEITFWVGVIGVPMEFRTTPTFESIGEALVKMVAVDVEHCRVQVVVDAFQELCFETTLDFKGGEFFDGEEAKISLRYKKLFGYCDVCSSLCHKEELCPLSKKTEVKASPEKRRENREGNGGWYDGGKHDDRARSYKGVVINGASKQQHKERDGRDYYGKGKGKMTEDTDLKWVKMADRGSKGSSNIHKGYRGDGEGSRYRSSRRDESQVDVQVGHARVLSEQTGAQQVHGEVGKEAQEDGEIRDPEVINKTLPSQKFQAELVKTQTLGTEALSDPMEVEKGLQIIQGLVEKQPVLEDDKVMNMDEFRAVFLEHGIDMDAADDLPEVSEGEMEEMMKEQEEGDNFQRELEIGTDAEEKEQVDGDAGKKHVSRKRLFKAPLSTAVSTKMRIASALASLRKRAPSKTGSRNGDNGKQQESKGPSNPKSGLPKP